MDKQNKLKITNKLIARIAKGDVAALDELYNEVGGLLYMMAKKYLIDKTLAEDLVSEILVRLVRRAKSFNVCKNGLNWLFKSIHNEAINWNNKYNPNDKANIDDIKYLSDVYDCYGEIENKIIIREALKTLSDIKNRALYYKFWECLTVRQIAQRINMPRSTTQDIINRALQKLDDIFNGTLCFL